MGGGVPLRRGNGIKVKLFFFSRFGRFFFFRFGCHVRHVKTNPSFFFRCHMCVVLLYCKLFPLELPHFKQVTKPRAGLDIPKSPQKSTQNIVGQPENPNFSPSSLGIWWDSISDLNDL